MSKKKLEGKELFPLDKGMKSRSPKEKSTTRKSYAKLVKPKDNVVLSIKMDPKTKGMFKMICGLNGTNMTNIVNFVVMVYIRENKQALISELSGY